MPTAVHRRRRAMVLGIAMIVAVLTLVVALASCSSPEARACEVLREHASTSAVLGSPIFPSFNDAESVERRIDVMDLVDPPASLAESWGTWRAHLDRAHTDLKSGITETQGLVWFPASPAVAQAGTEISQMYKACA